MTVIVMTKHEDAYYMTSDGRTSRGWMGIASDSTKKVFSGKDCIYGICGNASAKLIVKAILDRARDPLKVLKLLHHKDFKDILQECHVLVATRQHGCYTIQMARSIGNIFSGSRGPLECSIIPWGDENLPQVAGSGSLQIQALLSQYTKHSPEVVSESIKLGYDTNHTIGGKISQVSLELKTKKSVQRPKKAAVHRARKPAVKKIKNRARGRS